MINKKFFIDQHGCAKNQVDGELIISHLGKNGWAQTFSADEADLIIVNSCGFIEPAKEESIGAVISARRMYPRAKILLAGCLAQRYSDELRDELPEADGFFGNGNLDEIHRIIGPLMRDERPVLVPEQKGVCGGDRNLLLSFPGTAFVKITEGCNNRCSFCAIPVIRGELRSRKADEIIGEIKNLVAKGVYEINLIGQDLAAYGTGADDDCFGDGRSFLHGESGLSRLLRMISRIEGVFALRLLYIHPDHFNEDILPVMQSDARFLHYFDIPFQSGDDEIIKKMNRAGDKDSYLRVIEKIRSVFPDAAIRTTFLVGFPGESDMAFENTKAFMREMSADWSGCFPYSKEEDTPACDFAGHVPKKTAGKRAAELAGIQAGITRRRLRERVGGEYDALVEEVLSQSEESPDEGLAIGRAWFQAPEVDGNIVIRYDRSKATESDAVKTGRLVRVKIVSSGDVDLTGDFVGDSPLNEKISRGGGLSFAQE